MRKLYLILSIIIFLSLSCINRNSVMDTIDKQRQNLFRLECILKYNFDPYERIYGKTTPLLLALECGKENIFEELVKSGYSSGNYSVSFDINDKDSFGKSPIILSSELGYKHIVEMLIEKGANVNDMDNKNSTPLICALSDDKEEIFDMLIKNGADINIKSKKDNNTALIVSASNGYIRSAKKLIEKGVNVNDVNIKNQTPLMYASLNNHLEIVELLLKNGAIVNIKDKKSKTALFYASSGGNVRIVKKLLENGANINDVDINNRTCLMEIIPLVAKENFEVSELLLKNGINVNIKEKKNNRTAIIEATLNRCSTKFIEKLLEKGANINDVDIDGKSCLIYSLSKKYFEITEFLLKNDGIDVNIRDKNNKTALYKMWIRGRYYFQKNFV